MKTITITHGNGSIQTMQVEDDFDESTITPISLEVANFAFMEVEYNKQLKYLADTDWYLPRKMETGQDIPEEVLTKRQEARAFINANRAAIEANYR